MRREEYAVSVREMLSSCAAWCEYEDFEEYAWCLRSCVAWCEYEDFEEWVF